MCCSRRHHPARGPPDTGKEPAMPTRGLKLVSKSGPPRAPTKAIELPSEEYLAELMPPASKAQLRRAASRCTPFLSN
jgi:hypothetical protein